MRENKIKEVEGPFADLAEASEKQLKKGVMKLQFVDLRQNKLSAINLSKAVAFLRETVVLMWSNPFQDGAGEQEGDAPQVKETDLEYYDPSSLFR